MQGAPHSLLGLLLMAIVSAGFGTKTVDAQSSIPEITITGERGYPLALSRLSGPTGALATKVLEADLKRAGYFRFTTAPQGSFIVNGGATATQLDGSLTGPDGRMVFQRKYRGSSLEVMAHQFSDDIVLAITGKPGIASSQIAFVSSKSGSKELYLCNYDGSNVRQVTRDRSISVSPSISPNGKKLAYTGYASGYADIYLIDLPTGKRDRIIKNPGTNTGAAISPNGGQIALTMSYTGNPELYVTGIQGGRSAKRLTRSNAVESSPSWSPDGRSLVYTADGSGSPQIYTISAGGGSPRLISTGFGYATEPDWSPDGSQIVFSVRQGGIKVAVKNLKTGATRVLTSGSNAESPVWGADSRHIIYSQNRSIYLHDVATNQRQVILSGMGQIGELSWTR